MSYNDLPSGYPTSQLGKGNAGILRATIFFKLRIATIWLSSAAKGHYLVPPNATTCSLLRSLLLPAFVNLALPATELAAGP